jgi:S-adenosylmethionine:tRNA ribosyltransferase-isomerase
MDAPQHIRIADYHYTLPDERVARHPLPERDASRLLTFRAGDISDHTFTDLPRLLPEGTCLVFNDTKVIHARMRFITPDGHTVEVFCLAPADGTDPVLAFTAHGTATWQCMVGNNRRWKQGPLQRTLEMADGRELILRVERMERVGGEFTVRFGWTPANVPFSDVVERFGTLPIPPYLNRATEADDELRYQTVYARHAGSVAAPTAGLHFTDRVMDALAAKGIAQARLTLHVGAGTFRPVKSDTMAGHEMHAERISVHVQVLRQLIGCHSLIPVGTTSARTLESVYWTGVRILLGEWDGDALLVDQWDPYRLAQGPALPQAQDALTAVQQWLLSRGLDRLEGHTRLLIAPGYRFRVCRGLITNFHQPGSTLLLLVAALIGPDWRRVYHHALAHGYRFLSYGDSSLLLP